jgi:hypothetical protein
VKSKSCCNLFWCHLVIAANVRGLLLCWYLKTVSPAAELFKNLQLKLPKKLKRRMSAVTKAAQGIIAGHYSVSQQ